MGLPSSCLTLAWMVSAREHDSLFNCKCVDCRDVPKVHPFGGIEDAQGAKPHTEVWG